jgi:hypothetical protein
MADEELRISVKVDQEKAAENTRQLKDSFSGITDVGHMARLESLGRQFKLSDVQIKQLAETIGKPTGALGGFAMGFGRAGTILLAFEAAAAVAKAVHRSFTDAATRQTDVMHAAQRMGGIHAAQLDANLELMEREQIERGRGMAMMETFARRKNEFLEYNSQFRRSIMEDVEGPFAEVVSRHFFELEQAPDVSTMMNLVRKFSEEIDRYYTERGKPERGAQEKRKYLERWFGLPDIAQLTQDFVKVTKEAEEAWDRNQTAAKEYLRVTTDISNNLSKIISSVLTDAMDNLGIGGVLRFVNAFLERGAKEHGEIGAMSQEERVKYLDSLVREGDAAWRKAIIDFLFNSSPKSHDFPRPGGRPAGLLDDLGNNQEDLITEEKRLVENLQFLNALLSGESGIGGARGPEFHNAPQGGAEGESNPMQIPAGVAQPGGGSAAEARQPGRREWRPDDPSPTGYYTRKGKQTPFPVLSPEATALPTQPGYPKNPYTGVSEGKGVGTWFSQSPTGGRRGGSWRDPDDPANSAALDKIPDTHQGISLSSPATLGQFHYLTDPNTGLTHVVQQTDAGPGVRTQALVDISTNKALQMGYDQQSFEAQQDKLLWEVRPTGFDTMRPTSTGAATQKRTAAGRTDLPSGSDLEFNPFAGGGGSFGGGGATGEFGVRPGGGGMIDDADRTRFDQAMGDDMDVSGKLNVEVDAPRGTEVKASGGGMFANSTSVDRRISDEARP